MATPFFFVKKKDGKLWPCQDYRFLNEWTVKNVYPLPLIPELMDKIKDGKYFTKLDIWWGYNNVWIKEGDEWKAAFKMNWGLFELTVMFFGMCNSPTTFQAMMDDIFQDLIEKGIMIIYMDDMFLSAKTKDWLCENTKRVLQWLMENDLYLKPKKCEFCKEKIEWLGMMIQEGRITMDPGNLKEFRIGLPQPRWNKYGVFWDLETFEVFTLPHIFHVESLRSPSSPRTVLGLLLAGTPAKLESPSPNSVWGQS